MRHAGVAYLAGGIGRSGNDGDDGMSMRCNEIVALRRDCVAVLIPACTQLTLPAGQQVTITQALGGSYSCYVEGSLVRIASEDADALGKFTQQDTSYDKALTGDCTVYEKLVWEQHAP